MGANPVFRILWFVQRLRVVSSWNLESRISDSLPNMWNHQMFQKSIFSTRARDHFWRDMGANPVFRTFLFEVVRWWNLVCRYSMWPGVWLSEPNFNFRPWAFLWAQTPFFGLFYLKSYEDEIWYVGTLCDLGYECPNQISIFGLGPFLREPRLFRLFGMFKD